MNFCTKCGTKINKGQNFCSKCGQKISIEIVSKLEKKTKLEKIYVVSFITWLLCIAFFFFSLIIFGQDKQTEEIVSTLIEIFLIVGCLSFVIGIFSYCLNVQLKNKKNKSKISSILKSLFFSIVFPIYLIIRAIKNAKETNKKLNATFYIIISLFFLVPLWCGIGFASFLFIEDLTGLGSELAFANGVYMSPTLDNGDKFKTYNYENILTKLKIKNNYQIKYGDIIIFSNSQTKEFQNLQGSERSSYVSRVIAVPGNKIVIKNGIVFLNDSPLVEAYTLEPNSTYAYDLKNGEKHYGNFLPNCQELIISEGEFFVLNDNRKEGHDSRFFGLIKSVDIISYLPFAEQKKEYRYGLNQIDHSKKWRDTTNDLTEEILAKTNSSTCDFQKFYHQKTIDEFSKQIKELNEIKPGWKNLEKQKNIYTNNKVEVDRINEIILIRIEKLNEVLKKIKNEELLLASDEKIMSNDVELAKEQDLLAKKLNELIDQNTTNNSAKNQQTVNGSNEQNLISCTGPDGVVFKTTQKKCDDFNAAWGNEPTPNPNEYIRCNISTNCGGGYKEMTRSSCESLTCCQINNNWELRDKDQCDAEQKQQANAEWVKFCDNLYNVDNCSTYWETGTSGWYNCRMDAFNGRASCYTNY